MGCFAGVRGVWGYGEASRGDCDGHTSKVKTQGGGGTGRYCAESGGGDRVLGEVVGESGERKR